ncbi:hypothetical protein ADH67_10290 [Turicimonas muris]|uniref:Uncharacterized protein n=1 Tax=Turicimonas muris TaxID=1796652 RepID=A0A227KDV2_9BURK|nr:hypothetical protein ADH67_10290 [Turicimonas muris]
MTFLETKNQPNQNKLDFLIEKWVGKSIQKSKFSKNSALFVQFEVFRKNPQLTQNKIVRFHSIS